MSGYHVQVQPASTSQPNSEQIDGFQEVDLPENLRPPLLQEPLPIVASHPKKEFYTQFPTSVRPFAELQWAGGTMAGVLDKAYAEAWTDADAGEFHVQIGGLEVGTVDSPILRLGLEFMAWDEVMSGKRHKDHPYWKPDGPRWTVEAMFGRYDFEEQGRQLTLSGEQAAQAADDAVDEGTQAVLEAVEGEYDRAMGLKDAVDAILEHYHLEDDLDFSPLGNHHTEDFFSIGFTVTGPIERKTDPYALLQGFCSFSPVVGVYNTHLMQRDSLNFFLMPEASLLRSHYRGTQMDLMLSGGIFVGMGVDWKDLLPKDRQFFDPSRFFIAPQGSLSLRVTPNFKPKQIPATLQRNYERARNRW